MSIFNFYNILFIITFPFDQVLSNSNYTLYLISEMLYLNVIQKLKSVCGEFKVVKQIDKTI